MARYLFASVSVAVALAVSAVVGPLEAAVAAPPCDPIRTTPHFRGVVPTPEDVLGYPIGSREASAADIAAYVAAVDAASAGVVSGQFATSWEGRPLPYAIVGRDENVTPAGLAAVRANIAGPIHVGRPGREPRRQLAGDSLARGERPWKRGIRRGRRSAHPLRACRP